MWKSQDLSSWDLTVPEFLFFLNMYVIEKLLKNNPGKLVASEDSVKNLLSFAMEKFPPNLPEWYNRVALKSSISGSGGSSHNGSCSAKSTAVSNWLRNSSCTKVSRESAWSWWFFRIERSKGSSNRSKKCHAFWSSPTKGDSFGSNEVYPWHAFSKCFQSHQHHRATTSPLWNGNRFHKQGWWTIEHRPYRRKCNGPSWSSPHTLLISNTISMSLWQLFPRYSSSMLRLCVMGW